MVHKLFADILATEYCTVLVQVISVFFCIPPNSQLSFSRRLFPGIFSGSFSSMPAKQQRGKNSSVFFFIYFLGAYREKIQIK